jgi:hypothetical protein
MIQKAHEIDRTYNNNKIDEIIRHTGKNTLKRTNTNLHNIHVKHRISTVTRTAGSLSTANTVYSRVVSSIFQGVRSFSYGSLTKLGGKLLRVT